MRLLPLIAFSLALSGCATAAKPREATSLTIESKKTKQERITALVSALVKDGWKVRTIDKEAGLLVTEPKEFQILRGVLKVAHQGRASIQVLAEENTTQVQLTFECRYTQMNFADKMADAGFSTCGSGDADADAVIPEQERRIQELVRSAS